jgi:hypothetical protein
VPTPALIAILAAVALLLARTSTRPAPSLRLFEETVTLPQRRLASLFVSAGVHALLALALFTLTNYLFPPGQKEWIAQNFTRKPLFLAMQPLQPPPQEPKPQADRADNRKASPGPRAPRARRPKPAPQAQPAPEPQVAKARPTPKPFVPPPPPPPVVVAEFPRVIVPPSIRVAPTELTSLKPILIAPPDFEEANRNLERLLAEDQLKQRAASEKMHAEMLDNFQQTMLRVYSTMLSPQNWMSRHIDDLQTGSYEQSASREAGETRSFPLIRELHPNNGAFDVVVTSTGAPDGGGAALSGLTTYLVYLPVGASKQWILQYCLPRKAGEGLNIAGNVVQLPNPAPLKGPYPLVTVRPPVRLDPGVPYLVVHGYVDQKGRMQNLKVVRGAGPGYSELILGSLAQWEFRPATQDGRPVLVEVLLSIPPDAA